MAKFEVHRANNLRRTIEADFVEVAGGALVLKTEAGVGVAAFCAGDWVSVEPVSDAVARLDAEVV
jgi:hypothetical protein